MQQSIDIKEQINNAIAGPWRILPLFRSTALHLLHRRSVTFTIQQPNVHSAA